MLSDLLRLERPLFVIDAETTGLNPIDARIIELGFQQYTHEGLIKEWRSLVNPTMPIPASTTAVHGITDANVHACKVCGRAREIDLNGEACTCDEFRPWPTFKQLAPNLAKGLSDCDFAGKHVRFDLRVVAAEMVRANVSWSYLTARIIDADRLEALGEPRTLAHLYKKHLGRDMADAHQALADVQATAELIGAQLLAYPTLPRSLDQLHDLQWPGWLDSEGKFRFVNGVPTCQFGKHQGVAMQNIPVSYYDWLLTQQFPADVKELASLAKLGRFPERKVNG